MLSPRENLLETMRHGSPDRYVNQFEPFAMIYDTPFTLSNPKPAKGELNIVNAWGITQSFPANTPGAFPVHDADHIVCKDITHWRDYVKAPNVIFPAAAWAPFVAQAEAVNRREKYVTPFVAPGIFEQCHYLCEIQNTLLYFYTEPEAMHELIDYITDWEIAYAREFIKYLKPNAVYHHDDWGTQASTFLSPAMFEAFFLEPYKRLYGFYKANGVELIIHHSDSYAATLVPFMIEMGIDIWQGVMVANDIPGLIRQYGDKITFMGGINSASVDFPGWTPEDVRREVFRACDECGKYSFIPGASLGRPVSTFPGMYDEMSRQIDAKSKLDFT